MQHTLLTQQQKQHSPINHVNDNGKQQRVKKQAHTHTQQQTETDLDFCFFAF